MKRLSLIGCISMMVILGFAAFAWATEASVFDDAENVIIRACTSTGGSPYSVYLDVRDSTGALMPVGDFTVYDISTGLPVVVTVQHNPFQIRNDLTISDLSLTLDSSSGAVYLFCTNGGVDVKKYALTNLANGHCGASTNGKTLTTTPSGPGLCDTGTASSVTTTTTGWVWTCTGTTSTDSSNPPKAVNCSANMPPVNGVCGSTTNGGAFTSLSSTTSGLCNSGTVINFSGSGPWTWTCHGSNGGGDSSQCSANLQTWTVSTSASPTAGGSISPTSRTINNGSATSFTVAANSGYTISTATGCGGSLSGNTYTTGPITGTCTVTATFAQTWTVTSSATPTAGGSISPASQTVNNGSATSFTVAANSGYTISTVTGCGGSLSGSTYTTGPITGTCTVSATFSASTSLALLGFQENDGFVMGVNGPSAGTNGNPFSETVTIVNTGSAAAGPFTVKVWLSTGNYVNSYSTFLGQWSAAGLGAGQSVTHTISNLVFNGLGVHSGFNIITKIIDDIPESNEADCYYESGGYMFFRTTVGCKAYVYGMFIYR